MMAGKKHHCLVYLDDLAGCCNNEVNANLAFNDLKALSSHLGIQLSIKKCVVPVTSLEWLGYHIDTETKTISIPKKKLNEAVQECAQWLKKKKVKKSMIQSLVGKLSNIAD